MHPKICVVIILCDLLMICKLTTGMYQVYACLLPWFQHAVSHNCVAGGFMTLLGPNLVSNRYQFKVACATYSWLLHLLKRMVLGS